MTPLGRLPPSPRLRARIRDHGFDHEPFQDEQNDQRADDGGDKARALIGPIPADGLADESREKRPGDTDHGGEEEARGIVRAGRQDARDNAGDTADHKDPQKAAHDSHPFPFNVMNPPPVALSATIPARWASARAASARSRSRAIAC